MINPEIRRQTIADLLHRTARRLSMKTALVCGDVRWTFAEFDSVVDQGAAGLARMGVAHGSRVAVLSRNSHAFAALRFAVAVARLGAVLVPINFMLKAEEVSASA
jgi:fatty-acyl-CoA synthase